MSEWKAFCRVDDIPVLGARRIARTGSADVAIFRNSEDKIFALLDRCPHKGGPLSQGIVCADSVACPLHNWTIGLDDGSAKPPDRGRTQRFSVKVDSGDVLLDVEELATLALGPTVAPPVAALGAETAAAERPTV